MLSLTVRKQPLLTIKMLAKKIRKPARINFQSWHFERRFTGFVTGLFTLYAMGSLPAQAVDRFSLTLGAKENWDSNFARNAAVDSEHYTQSTASLRLNQKLSKQQFSVGVSGNDYRHSLREDLDVSFYEGDASWRSDWNSRVKTAISWQRDAYAVDRLEFADKDVVARNNLTGQLTLGSLGRIGFTFGARQIAQTHSNPLREVLDYDDDEGFAAITYTRATQSFLSVRLREGERHYKYPFIKSPFTHESLVLDFDYRQLELEGAWALSRKTQLGFTLGRFDRDGQINTGTGTQAQINMDWAITEKLKLSVDFSQSEPALGETSDSPAVIRSSRLVMGWEPSAKWLLSMSAGYSQLSYLLRETEPARDENILSFSPLNITYSVSDNLRMRLDSQWVDRESPLVYRDYDYALASFGVTLMF